MVSIDKKYRKQLEKDKSKMAFYSIPTKTFQNSKDNRKYDLGYRKRYNGIFRGC